jgi:hypothetical protein
VAELSTVTQIEVGSPTPTPTSLPRHALWSRRLTWWVEVLLAVGAYELYNAVQALTAGDRSQARAHGLALESAEKRLHVWIEPTVNRFATAHSWIALGSGYYYALGHVLVTFSVLVFLWIRRPSAYIRLRNALVVMSCLALIAFWWWPVAPPRITISGLTDTLTRNDILGAAHVHAGLVNVYAAMPSLHVAWATWCAGSVVITARGLWRHLAWLYPIATTFVVIATANHYLFDAAAGFVLAGLSLAVVMKATGPLLNEA